MITQVELTKEQHLYLQQILNFLRQNSQWPSFGELDKWFTLHYPDLDIEEIWQSLPHDSYNRSRGMYNG